MKKYYVNYKEVDETHLNIEMHKALKREFGGSDYKFIKELMIENKKSLNEVGRNNINDIEFEIMYVAMSLDEKFELYLEYGFTEFLEILENEKEITSKELKKYESELYLHDDNDDIRMEIKLKIMDELGMDEHLFIEYQRRMGEL